VLDVIDHDVFARRFGRLELETELIFERGKYRRRQRNV
jgi:hypothetical protein